MEALLKLVATEGDGKTTSLGPLFDLKLEEAGVHKSLSLYKEKRFTQMGYQVGAILDCRSKGVGKLYIPSNHALPELRREVRSELSCGDAPKTSQRLAECRHGYSIRLSCRLDSRKHEKPYPND